MNRLYALLLALCAPYLYGKVAVVNNTGTVLTGTSVSIPGGQVIIDTTNPTPLDEGLYNFMIQTKHGWSNSVILDTKHYKQEEMTFTFARETQKSQEKLKVNPEPK